MIDNFRSAIGGSTEDLPYLLYDLIPEDAEGKLMRWLRENAGNVVDKNTAGQIGNRATEQFGLAKEDTGEIGDMLIDLADESAAALGYSLLGPKAESYLHSLGNGLGEYRNLRESGIDRSDALSKAAWDTDITFAGEKTIDYGVGKLWNNLFGNKVIEAGFNGNQSSGKKAGTVSEDFFGEKREITTSEHEEVLHFKNFKDRIEIQNGVSCFPKAEEISENVKKVKPAIYDKTGQYYFDIGMHGNSSSVAFARNNDAATMTPKALAIAISQNTGYKKGQPVRLLSCSTGQPRKYDDCFAQKLANELNAPVKAPTDTLFIDRKGNYTIGKNNTGQWINFLPHYSVTNSFDANWRIAERMNRR